MPVTTVLGILAVAVSGLIVGSGAWPFKLMRTYQFEHWWFVGSLVGLLLIPWTVVLVGCPNALQCLRNVPLADLIKGNALSVGWGIACILLGLCYVRIGVGLSGAILSGLGVSVGAITPLIFKGSGVFSSAPAVDSAAGLTVVGSVAMMITAVVIAALAGFGRDRELKRAEQRVGSFGVGLIMATVAGLLSACTNFAFVYGHDAVLANLNAIGPGSSVAVAIVADGVEQHKSTYLVDASRTIEIGPLGPVEIGPSAWHAARQIEQRWRAGQSGGDVRVHVETGSIAATFGAFAVPLIAGTLINLGYAAYLLFRNRSWGLLAASGGDMGLSVILGVNSALGMAMMAKGMLLLGAIGASVGWGIYQAMQLTGSQGLGFLSGEWRGVHGKPRRQMYIAISILIVAALVMAYGKTLSTR
jgi:hypothetical protein